MKKYYIGFLVFAITPALTFASIDTNLKYGSRGQEVIELQEFLISHSFLKGSPSGNFYSLTRNAVIAYQKSINVTSSGFVGPLTRTQINSALAIAYTISNTAEVAETKKITPSIDISKQPNEPLKQQVVEQQNTTQVTNQFVTNIVPSQIQTQKVQGPAEISIQSNVCNLSSTNLKTTYSLENLLLNGNTDGRIVMNAYVLTQEKQNYYTDNPSDVMIITTSNHSNDKTLNGSGNTSSCGYYYPYELYVTAKGTYTITYSLQGLEKNVTIAVK
jgi:hypothetical protein